MHGLFREQRKENLVLEPAHLAEGVLNHRRVIRNGLRRKNIDIEEQSRTLLDIWHWRLHDLDHANAKGASWHVEGTLIYEFLQRQVRWARWRLAQDRAQTLGRSRWDLIDKSNAEPLN